LKVHRSRGKVRVLMNVAKALSATERLKVDTIYT